MPGLARIKQLYAWGHTPEAIVSIYNEEFQDIEINPLSYKVFKDYLRQNFDMLEAAKTEFAAKIDELSLTHMKEVVGRVATSENKMVVALAKKMDEIVLQIAVIDMSEIDSNGKPKNLSSYLTWLEALERTAKLTERYSGTGSLRDLNIYTEKARIDAQYKNNNPSLIPDMPEASGGSRPAVYTPNATDEKKSLDV